MVDKAANTNLVPEGVLAERESLANKIGAALVQDVVEPLDMSSLSGLFTTRSMALGKHYSGVGSSEIRVVHPTLAFVGWK